jgi:hypothetical protein
LDEKNFDRIKFFLRSLTIVVERLYLPPALVPTTHTTDASTTTSTSTTATTATTPTPKSTKAEKTAPIQAVSPAKDSIEKLAKTIFALLTKTKAKATARVENTFLYFILMNFAKNNKAVEAQAEKEGIWTYFFSPASFILTEGYCERLDASAFPVLYKLLGSLLEDWKKYKLLPASRFVSLSLSPIYFFLSLLNFVCVFTVYSSCIFVFFSFAYSVVCLPVSSHR